MYFLGTTPSPSSRRPANAPGSLPEKRQYNSYSGFLFDEHSKGLFTWRGGPRCSGVGFFCFHALGDTKQKKPTPLDPGFPTPCKQALN